MADQTRIGMITPSLNTVLEPVTYGAARGPARRHRALQPGAGEQHRARREGDGPVRRRADAGRRAPAGRCARPRDLLERHRRKLARPRLRPQALRDDRARDRHPGDERHAWRWPSSSAAGGVSRFALVTPFESALQEAIIETYGREGFQCVAERHLDSDDTFGYATIPAAETEGMIRAVAGAEPEAIARGLHEPQGRAPRARAGGGGRPPDLRQRGGGALGHAGTRRCGPRPHRRLGRDLLRRPRLAGAPRRPAVARISHQGHGLRGAVRPAGQERRAARCGDIGQAS